MNNHPLDAVDRNPEFDTVVAHEFEPASDPEFDPFADTPVERVVASTEAQREVWLACELSADASLAFNESVRLTLNGRLDVTALRAAIGALVARHESLRTSIGPDGAELIINAPSDVVLPVVDLRTEAPAARDARVLQAQVEEVTTVFDLKAVSLFRARLLCLADDQHQLLMTAHHIICDGWSWGVLARDLGALYDEQLGIAPTPPAPLSFASYVEWESSHQQGADYAASERYWLSRFAGAALPVLDLPVDRPRPANRRFDSRRVDHVLPADLVEPLRKLAGRLGVSYFGLMFSAFSSLLHRLGGGGDQHTDLVIGVPAAGQSASGLHNLAGHCVNLLPVRVPVDPAIGFDQFARAAGSTLLDGFEHQTVTYGSLLKKLPVQRDPSRLPLVSVMFNVDSAVDGKLPGFDGLSTRFESNPRHFENFELFVNATPEGKTYRLELQYNSGLFDDATVRRWARCFEALLRDLLVSATTPLAQLNIVGPDDRRALDALQPVPTPYPRHQTMVADFIKQAASAPQRVAIEWRGATQSYRELDQSSNRLARALRARGVSRGTRVGICLERNADTVVALLAVLKAGGAYVPLDPAFPPARLEYYAQDAKLTALLTDSTLDVAPRHWRDDAAGRIIELDADSTWRNGDHSPLPPSDLDAGAEDPAYIIYTSGSTGKPKGVCVPHRAAVSFLDGMRTAPGMTADDRIAAVTTLSFDPSVLELFLPLSIGATIIMVDKATMMDGPALGALLDSSKATLLQATPTLWRLLLDTGWRAKGPFKALIGAEPLSPTLAAELLAVVDELWNIYGPTETTVWATAWKVELDQVRARGISIGRPISNVTVWVVDPQGQLCPVGVPGELCIGGANMTLGYVDRPDLNEAMFIRDPFTAAVVGATEAVAGGALQPSGKPIMYRTGDLGRWANDGQLDHLGRLDFQVKVRGFRIELGEIEAACNQAPGVARTVVLAREDRPGDVRLVAYLTTKSGSGTGNGASSHADGAYDEAVLRGLLRKQLPDYMVPAFIVTLASFPTMPNGKVDRKQLPAPDQSKLVADSERVAPRDDVERVLMAAMERVLSLPGIGIHDDFFGLGGHSLLAARMIAITNQELALNLNLRALFEAPTVERLAREVQRARGGGQKQRAGIIADPSRREAPSTVMQERICFVEELMPGRSVYHESSAHRLTGPFDFERFKQVLALVFKRQSTLRTAFRSDGQGGSVQTIAAEVVPDVAWVDLSSVPAAQREGELSRRMQAVIETPMNLAVAPLCHTALYKLSEHEHVFLFVPHHLIWDGWSFDLLYEEMANGYRALAEGTVAQLPPLPVSYADYSVWHQQWLDSDEYREQLEYWKKRLSSAPVPKPWPADRTHRQSADDIGGSEWIHIDQSLTTRLLEVARSAGVTLSMLTLAVFAGLTQRLAQDSAVSIGLPVRGRQMREIESVMGFFNNLVAVQMPVDDDTRVLDFSGTVRAEMLEVFAHQDMPFERLLKVPELMPRMQRAGLYQVMFSFQDGRGRPHEWGPLHHHPVLVHHKGASNDLGLWLLQAPEGIDGAVLYNSSLFDQAAAARLRDQYVRMLEVLCDQPDSTMGQLLGTFGAADIRRTQVAASATAAASDTSGSKGVDPVNPSASMSPTEQMLAAIWRQLLDVRQIERQDNFFDLGGSSLLAINAAELILARSGKRVNAGSFAFETLAQIALALDKSSAMAASSTTEASLAPGKPAGGGLLRKLGSVFRR